MNVVDSSAWLEYFGDGDCAPEFAAAIESPDQLIVPSLTLFEVFKRTCQLSGEATAFDVVGVMVQGEVADLTAELALEAARLSLETGLAMADSIILATARTRSATLWTQDAHFEGVDGVEFRPKSGSG
ncbi:MAG: type II toxin-antitoxin system VapC family toxin [Anaerosomatales bacterium]|nr:type II toxin-antitoxin system VapC family toxin [Coriobacteriia bacterium]MDF1543387.1 type II toxin-antitoxin system VapC family toxin [Anaerosomatales bacterium]MDT8434998.1 type II toxin-antitoxin system VapC family toxin [Anaerosomatales bacterium]